MKHLTFTKNFDLLNQTTEHIHTAMQLLSMAGKFFHTSSPDDGHTNAMWDVGRSCFSGRALSDAQGAILQLYPIEWKWVLTDNLGSTISELDLAGKSLTDGVVWFTEQIGDRVSDPHKLRIDYHYNPADYLLEHDQFPDLQREPAQLFADLRSLSDQFIKQYKKSFERASEARTWPHHFDHGVYIPFKFDENGNPLQSLSVGYAIHDTLINEPYLYLTQWAKNREINYSDVPLLKSGLWMPDKLNGAALSLSEIIQSPNQRQIILNFLNNTLQWSLSAKVIEQ